MDFKILLRRLLEAHDGSNAAECLEEVWALLEAEEGGEA